MFWAWGMLFVLCVTGGVLCLRLGARAWLTLATVGAAIAAYVVFVTSRPLTPGTGTIALVLVDIAVLALGLQGTLRLLQSFDPPNASSSGGDGGLTVAPGPQSTPPMTPAGIEPADWVQFDEERTRWEQRSSEPLGS